MNGLSADLVITGGHVITVNPKDETAEAVAVLGDKIVAVGKADEIAPFIGDTTDVIQLNGQTVLPVPTPDRIPTAHTRRPSTKAG